MLRSAKELKGYTIQALDGEIGKANEFYFDDMNWVIRYLVVDTGTWLPGKKVLISPVSLDRPDWNSSVFPVRLIKDQVKNSPGIEENKPVSRQHEEKLVIYYGWPAYWMAAPLPGAQPAQKTMKTQTAVSNKKSDSSLRSTEEVIGYQIKASDGEIGHVEDFIVEDRNWTIQYMVVDTRNWMPGKKVLVSPHWINRVSWADARVFLILDRESIKESPEYDPSLPINRQYEERLYDFYGRPKYWENDSTTS